MSDILEKICADKRAHVAHVSKAIPFEMVDAKARKASPVRGFAKALQAKVSTGGIGLIAEIKKASPSAGVIRADFSPADLAQAYEKGGAACLSVLTDAPYFQGKNEDLVEARAACNLPVLRKDFMLDLWQVAEARAAGADCILLIMAALNDQTALALHKSAIDYGMDVLIEVHDRHELDRALKLPSGLIGINNRNLKTLKIDLAVTEELAPLIPKDRMIVSESGISTPADLARMKKCNVHCFLVGESLLKQPDVERQQQKSFKALGSGSFRLQPRRTKPAGAAFAFRQFGNFIPFNACVSRDHHLRDAHAARDGETFAAEIGEDHLHLAAVIGIDGAGAVQNRKTVFQREAGTRPHLRFIPFGQGDHQAGRHQRAGARRQNQILGHGGAQIHTGGMFGCIGRQIKPFGMRQGSDGDSSIFHKVSPILRSVKTRRPFSCMLAFIISG